MYHRPGYNIATQPVLQSVNEEKHFHCSPKSIFFTEHHYKWEKSVKLLTGHLELQTWLIMIHSVILFWSMGDLIFVKPSFSRETLFKNLWHQHNVNLLWEKHHIFIRLLTQEINPEAPIFYFFYFFFGICARKAVLTGLNRRHLCIQYLVLLYIYDFVSCPHINNSAAVNSSAPNMFSP